MTDENEGWFVDTVNRIAFGAPPRSCLLRKADGEQSAEPVTPGEAYVSMTLVDQKLAKRRIFTSQFEPVFYADISVPQGDYKPVSHSTLIPTLPEEIAENTADKAGAQQGDRPVFGQTPYQGRLNAQINLLACRSEDILKSLMPVAAAIQDSITSSEGGVGEGDLPDSPSGADLLTGAASAAVDVASRVMFPQRIAVDIAKATAKSFMSMDGRWTPRFEFSGPITDLQSGYYVIFNARSKTDDLKDLRFDHERRMLFSGNKQIKSRDYLVFEIARTGRRENIESVPGLGAALNQLDNVFVSGGVTDDAFKQFQRQVLISPHLINADRQALINRVGQRLSLMDDAKPATSATNESLFDPGQIGDRLRSLKAIWDAAETLFAPIITAGIEGMTPAEDAEPEIDTPEPVATIPAPTPVQPQKSRFQLALNFALRWEGGFSDDPLDAGGRTNRGITERVYHAWLANRGEDEKPVEHITDDEVRSIYNNNYWRTGRSDALSPDVDWLQFDASVNHGPGGAKRLLQRALVACGHDISVDGMVGPKTLEAASLTRPADLGRAYLEQRSALYHRIVERKPDQKRFIRGWLNRISDLARATKLTTESLNESVENPIEPENTAFAEFIE